MKSPAWSRVDREHHPIEGNGAGWSKIKPGVCSQSNLELGLDAVISNLRFLRGGKIAY